jgi:hypothetical protein
LGIFKVKGSFFVVLVAETAPGYIKSEAYK